MLKKIAFAVAVMLVPVFIFAGGMIEKGTQTYNDIEKLIGAGVITKPLVKQSLTREEVVGYINDGVDNVLYAAAAKARPAAARAAGPADIEKLYNLVKQYMGDMQKADKKLNDILEVMGDLKVRKAELEKKQDRLLNLMGLRINGESSAYMTDLSINYMNAAVNDESYRPITQYIDLKFSLNANKDLYAEATFRLQNLFGGFWGSYDIYGLKRFFVQGKYPISFVLGDYQGKLTPLTLWAVDDKRPFESRIYSDRRDMIKNELYLIDDSWPLSGGKVHTIIELFDTLDINLQVLGARLSQFAQGASKPFTYYGYSGDSFLPVNYLHDQYMIGGRVSTDATLTDMLEIGFNFNEIIDAKDTGTHTAPVINNYVGSADAEFKLGLFEGAYVKASGEFAMSWYTANKFVNPYITDTALVAGLEASMFDTKLSGKFRMVGKDFTSFAAQTRIEPANLAYDTGAVFYNTQNNTWNIGLFAPAFELGGTVYPFTRYQPKINVSYIGPAGTKGALMQGLFYENIASYAGDATPDRLGATVELSGSYLDGLVMPAVKFEYLTEDLYPARNFTVLQGGVSGKLAGLSYSAGYQTEIAEAFSGDKLVSYIIDSGVSYALLPKKLNVYAGGKYIGFEGQEDLIGDGITGISDLKGYSFSSGLGVEYIIAKPAKVAVTFTTTKIGLILPALAESIVNELDVKVSINF